MENIKFENGVAILLFCVKEKKMEKQEIGKINIWEINDPIEAAVAYEAKIRGLSIGCNRTTFAEFAGRVSYIVWKTDGKNPPAITHNRCMAAYSTPYSKYFKPSACGERECLNDLLDYICSIKICEEIS